MDRLSQILKIDFPYFFRGGFWLSVGQLSSIAFSFLLALIFARNLDPQTYGQYRYLMSLTSIITAFSLTGLGVALSQAVAAGKERTLLTLFRKQLLWSLPVFLIGIALTVITFARGNYLYGWVFLLFAVAFTLSNAAGLFSHFLNGKGNFSLATKYYLLSSLITNGFLCIFAFFFSAYFLFLFPLIFVLEMGVNVIFYRKISAGINHAEQSDSHAISYGKQLSVINVLATVADQIDSTVLFWLAGPQILAIYSFANAAPEIIKNFFKSSVTLSMPKLSVMDKEEIRKTLPKHALKVFLLSLVLVTAYILAAPYLFSILFPKYLAAILPSQIIAISLLSSPGHLFLSAFQAKKEIRKLYFVNIANNLMTITLTVLFIYLGGLYGLVISRVVSRFFAMLSFVFAFYFL